MKISISKILLAVIAVLVFGATAVDPSHAIVVSECNNGSSNSTTSSCPGISCGGTNGLCDEPSFAPTSEDKANCLDVAEHTLSWTKYEGTQDVLVACDPFFGYCAFYVFNRITALCSTADKENPADQTKLRYGACNCSAGTVYKACCLRSNPTQSEAAHAYDIDHVDPLEADCRSTSYTTRIRSGGPYRCPQNPVISLTASAASITAGQSATLNWTVTGTDTCTITANVGTAPTGSFPNGSATVSPAQTTIYSVNCTSPYQVQNSSFDWVDRTLGPVSRSVTITVGPDVSVSATVTPSSSTPPDACISPDSALYKSTNHSASISWTSSGARVCTISDNRGGAATVATSPRTVTPTQATTYTITCYENANMIGGDSASDTVTVNVRNCARESISFPGTFVEWYDPDGVCNSNYDDCRYETGIEDYYYYCRNSGANPCTRTSSLYAITAAGKAQCEANLQAYLPGQTTGVCYRTSNCDNMCGAPSTFSVNLTASPSNITTGQSATLNWNAPGATNCSINQGVGAVGTSGSNSVSPLSTTTYTLTCYDVTDPASSQTSSATVTVNAAAGCYTGPRAVSASISATRECLPFQPGNIRSSQLNWSGSALNVCSSIIGGGSPSSNSFSCSNSSSNWTGSGTSGSYTLNNVSSTASYSVQCTRSQFTCSSSQTFSYHDNDNDTRCTTSCTNLRASYPAITSCSCSQGSCVEDWPHTPDSSHCDQHACGTTYEVCDTCCPSGWVYPPIGARTCPGGTEDCNCRDICNYDGDCIDWDCRYHAENQSVSSQTVCSSSDSDSQQVRFMQQPSITRFEPSKPQILLNQVFDILWDVLVPSSGVSTVPKCTPSMLSGGDGRGWTHATLTTVVRGVVNGLGITGPINDLSPQRTTTYELQCRNNDQTLCGNSPADSCSCYNESTLRSFEMKVFEPYLQEKSPSLLDVFSRAMGSMMAAMKSL